MSICLAALCEPTRLLWPSKNLMPNSDISFLNISSLFSPSHLSVWIYSTKLSSTNNARKVELGWKTRQEHPWSTTGKLYARFTIIAKPFGRRLYEIQTTFFRFFKIIEILRGIHPEKEQISLPNSKLCLHGFRTPTEMQEFQSVESRSQVSGSSIDWFRFV